MGLRRRCASMTAVNQVVLEHLVMRMAADGRLALTTALEPLPPMADPVQQAEAAFPGTFTHSTSWRWSPDGVLLTFTHVHPDPGSGDRVDPDDDTRLITVLDLEQLPVACHAVRHLHFLERTDPQVAALAGYDRFWAFAAEVAAHHYPAVAGLLPGPPEYHI
jgi:hypothetical protein